MHTEILIIGAGPAGFNAAKAARKYEKQVTLVGAEPFLPYWRPRLPEIIRTGAEISGLLMQNEGWFESAGIRFLPGKRAAEILPAQKTVRWEDGGTETYDALVLACGATSNIPKVPFAEKVRPLRTYADALEIRAASLAAGRAFVVGGGVLGLEAAYAILQLGCRVVVSDISPYPMSRQLDREGGMFLKKRLDEKGIAIRAGTPLGELRGEIEGACVVAAAGVRPAAGLAAACGIRTNRGVLVDDRMQTSEESVYACGDLAEFTGAMPGLMTVAAKQGETAGANAAGGDARYGAVLPSPMTRVAGIPILSVGSVAEAEGTRLLRREDGERYAVAAVSAGKLVGAAFVGDTAPGMKFKRFIEAGGEVGNAADYGEIERAVG